MRARTHINDPQKQGLLTATPAMSSSMVKPSQTSPVRALILVLKLLLLLLGSFGLCILVWCYQYRITGVNPHSHIADWAHEADPYLRAAVSGHFFNMFGLPSGPPLMMPFALLIRLPALSGLGYAITHFLLPSVSHANGWWINSVPSLGPGRLATINFVTDTQRYEIGAIAVFAFATAMVVGSLWYRASVRQRVSVVVATLFLLFSPLSGEALRWSHPEEFLLAATVMWMLLAAGRGRWTLAAVAAALAFATKQPAWLVAPTLLFIFPMPIRWRALALAFGLAIIICAPFLLPHLSAVWDSASGQLSATPNSGDPQMHISIWGALGVSNGLGGARYLTLLIAVLLPVGLAMRRGWQLSVVEASGVIVLVLIARAVFDPFDISYYLLPAVGALFALEQNLWMQDRHFLRRPLPFLRNIPIASAFASVILGWSVGAFNNNWDSFPITEGSFRAAMAVAVAAVIALIVWVVSVRTPGGFVGRQTRKIFAAVDGDSGHGHRSYLKMMETMGFGVASPWLPANAQPPFTEQAEIALSQLIESVRWDELEELVGDTAIYQQALLDELRVLAMTADARSQLVRARARLVSASSQAAPAETVAVLELGVEAASAVLGSCENAEAVLAYARAHKGD
jgi:hypothetical protein